MSAENKEHVIQMLAEGVAKKALGIEWEYIGSQARRVAKESAAALYELVRLATEVENAESPLIYDDCVRELLDFIGVPARGQTK